MRRVGPYALSLLILASLGARAAEQEPEGRADPIVSSGVATLEVDGRRTSIPFAQTPSGPLFALAPIVAQLGGELEIGPLHQSHTLRLQDVVAVFGPDSPALVLGEEVVTVRPAPAAAASGLLVPQALLARTYGDVMGYELAWDGASGTLHVARRAPRELPLSVEVVHLQNVTTLVLRFPEQPHYRILRPPGMVEVEVAGDRLRLVEQQDLPAGSLIRRVEVGEQRVGIELRPGTEAADYALSQPFRLVFDVHAQARSVAEPEVTTLAPDHAPGVRTIVLDPGHGGRETGAIGASGAAEKDLCLLLAQSLEGRLEQRLGVKVVLTRDQDEELPLETRTALANQQKADLFISIHLNSSLGNGAQGAETYFLSLKASDERAARVAEEENRQGSEPGDGDEDALSELQLMLWDLAQSHHLAESQRLAALIQDELNQALGLRNRGVKQAPLAVLRGAAMPAVLVEVGFLSNPEEEAKLQDPAYRADLVESLVRAITRYKAQLEDRGGAPAEEVR